MNSQTVENLGWALVNSAWQIAAVWLALRLGLRALENFSANARCLLATAAILLALALPAATFLYLQNDSPANQISLKTYNAETFNSVNAEAQTQESRRPVLEKKMRTVDGEDKGIFFSFERLRESFKLNFASALPFLVFLWTFGVAAFAARLTGGVVQLRRYKTRETAEPQNKWQTKFSALRARLKISQTVKLLESNLLKTPVVVGWLKPVVLIPAGVFLQMPSAEIETILAHELLHIRRRDNFINFIQNFAEILFFYHPCVWWISRVIRREREFACDAAVLEMMDSPRTIYANALANLEEIRRTANQTLPPLASAATGGNLMQRIERILQKNAENKRATKPMFWSAGFAFALISAILLTVFSFNTSAPVNAQTAKKEKKIAVGFVSLPPLDRSDNPPKDADSLARLLIAKLSARKVPAIGFVLGGSTSDGEKLFPVRANIVRLWRDAGFEIGIGGYKHIWFYDTPVQDYIANAEKNEKVVKQILAEKNLPLRWFSYPFLGAAKTAEDKAQFDAWLTNHNLRSVKYTFDNQEWMYSYAYDMARNDNDMEKMKQIQAEFVDYMAKMTDHYEAYSQEMFGRDIAQTMVLTPSRLVADSFDEVFGMLEKRGYKFVSMDEAQRDEAYNTPEKIIDNRSGISWFERWQMAQGKKLRDEPRVAADVLKTWNERKK